MDLYTLLTATQLFFESKHSSPRYQNCLLHVSFPSIKTIQQTSRSPLLIEFRKNCKDNPDFFDSYWPQDWVTTLSKIVLCVFPKISIFINHDWFFNLRLYSHIRPYRPMSAQEKPSAYLSWTILILRTCVVLLSRSILCSLDTLQLSDSHTTLALLILRAFHVRIKSSLETLQLNDSHTTRACPTIHTVQTKLNFSHL